MDPEVPVGRESELPEVERFLASRSGGARALVLSGEPGIGKTTLWEAGSELARSRDFCLLVARASESETHLAFAGLGDLLDGIDLDALVGLPAARRHALEVAVGRAEASGPSPEPYAISMGLLDVLRSLAARGPLLIAIDDLPWLDPESASSVVFAARRLADHDVVFLVTRRAGAPTELERVVKPRHLVELTLRPLSFGAISHLLAERFGVRLPRRIVRQVFDTSQGNPLFALELARVLVERGPPEIGVPLPVPDLLDEVFRTRIEALRPDVRRSLLAVSVSGGLRREELASVVDPLTVQDAQASGALVADRERLRAAHPLLAAAAVQQSTARERRDVHLALGATVGDELLRARHLALAADAPDAELAAEVSDAAGLATERGAVHDAVALAEHALRLTAKDDAAYVERLLALARCLDQAGETPRLVELLRPRLDELPPGRLRAEALLLLATGARGAAEYEDLLRAAIAERADDPGLQARAIAKRVMLLTAGCVSRTEEAERLATEALVVAGPGDTNARHEALVALAWARILRGRAIDDLLQPSAGTITGSIYDTSLERPLAVRLAFRGEVERARESFRRLHAVAEERGEARSGAALQLQLCEVELRAGDVRAAARMLEEFHEWIALEPEGKPWSPRVQALLAALRGGASRAARRTMPAAAGDSDPVWTWDRLERLRAAGLAALLERDPEGAVAALKPVWEHQVREGVEDPGAFPVAGDLVEALVELDRLDEASTVIAWLQPRAEEQSHPWGLATATRAAAAVRLAEGYDDGPADALAGAAADYLALGLGFEHARTLLFLGRAQRRFRKRAAARLSLEEARSGFERLGCDGWARLAAAELERVSGRRPQERGDLTASERRVAELVASGLSNKEVAAQLFVTVHTVEAHLSSAYAKLGIRSRTQLARRLAAPS